MELMPNRAYHITVEGSVTETSPLNGKTFELEEAQKMVEGLIEIVYLHGEQIMIVNENGKFGKRYNPVATAIAHLHGSITSRDYICGNVVICPSPMLP